MLITAQVLKEKWLKIMVFAHSQTTNKLVNEAVHDSAQVSGQDRKIPPALGINQIARFGGFRPLTSLKNDRERPVFLLVINYKCIIRHHVYEQTNKKHDITWVEKVDKRIQYQKKLPGGDYLSMILSCHFWRTIEPIYFVEDVFLTTVW